KVAGKLLIQRRNEAIEGKTPIKEIKNYTFRELANEYHKFAQRQKSYLKSKVYLINQLTQIFGNLPLKRFTPMLLEQYQTDKLQKGSKPSTVNRLLATISHMFTKAVEWEMLSEDILKKIRNVKFLPENNKRLRYLSNEECCDLIDACLPHLKPVVIMAINTGMRKEEILSLEWKKHIDLKNGFILLDVTKNGERREIPINQTLRDCLQSIVIKMNSPFVFNDSNGQRFGDVKKSFKSACQKAGISDFRFHDLRHTFASHLVMAGVDLVTVKNLLGHKSLSMTLRYAHLAPSHTVKAVEALDTRLSEKQSIQKVYNLEK
ncbi:MAG: site-specific integrase, partial [Candidatus Scalindua sp.]|nr:site-specific integrase [Candidatus Scalindua sp.]